MPDRYEREIEDILRNMKQSEDRPAPGLRPRRPDIRPARRTPSFNFAERCLAIGIAAALIAGGWSYATGDPNLLTGLLALVGVVCLALVACSTFIVKERPSSSNWRR